MRHLVLTVAVSQALAGCAAFPSLLAEPNPSVGEILALVRCELQRGFEMAASRGANPVAAWTAKVTLDVKVVRVAGGTGNADVDFIVLAGTNTLVPGLSLGLSRTATQTQSYVVNVKLADLAKCTSPVDGGGTYEGRFVAGFGLSDWIGESAHLDANLRGLSTSIDFAVKADAGLKGVFAILPARGTLSGTFSRSDSHVLTVALSPPTSVPSAIPVYEVPPPPGAAIAGPVSRVDETNLNNLTQAAQDFRAE